MNIYLWFQAFFKVLGRTSHVIIFQIILLLLILGSDQLQDIFKQDFSCVNNHYFLFYLSLLVLCCQSWLSSRLSLEIADLSNELFRSGLNAPSKDKKGEVYILSLQKWLPRIIGNLPLFILVPVFFNIDKTFALQPINWVLIVITFFLFNGIWFLKRWLENKSETEENYSKSIIKLKSKPINLFDSITIVFLILAFLLGALFFVLFIIPAWAYYTAPYFGSISIIVLSIAGLIVLFSASKLFGYWIKLPTTGFFILMAFFSSSNNNNHGIRQNNNDKENQNDSRLSFSDYYDNWKENKTYATIYIVAAEGGGIRSSYWTAAVLDKISKVDILFNDKLFAISGVSGGTVGAAFYLASLKNKNLDSLKASLSHDFVSPLISAYLTVDFIQRFFPIPFSCFDRARYLEYSFEKGFATSNNNSTILGDSFNKLWYNIKGQIQTDIPLLFVNSTVVQTGQHAIYAPIKWNYDTTIKDIYPLAPDIPLSTAALLSARFPYVTPAGRIKDSKNVIWDFVDGGYFENSGLATAFLIKSEIEKYDSKIKVKIIFIRNGDSRIKNEKGSDIGYETKTPLNTMLNAWNRKTDMVLSFSSLLEKKDSNDVIMIELIRKDEELIPLGWTLSDAAVSNLEKHLKDPKVESAIGLIK